MLHKIISQLIEKVYGLRVIAQQAFEQVVESWLEKKSKRRAQYYTDGKSIFYFESEVARWVKYPDIFELNNQGYTTETTARIFNTFFTLLGFKLRAYREGGHFKIYIEDEDRSLLMPLGEWVKFNNRTKKILTNLSEEMPPWTITKVLDKIITELKMIVKLHPEIEIKDIKIPGTDMSLEEIIYDPYMPRYMRFEYEIHPYAGEFFSNRNEKMWWSYIRSVIKRLIQQRKLYIEKIYKRLF